MKDLAQKVAIVTGAARGTGAAIAQRFADHGTHVVLGDILHEEGERVAKEIGALARYVPLDVTEEAQWAAMVAAAAEVTGRVDILVNNAAVLHLGNVSNTSADDMRRLFEVNTLGPFLGLRAVLDRMRAQGGGSIVNVGSVDALIGMNGITAYCASKWGLRGWTKAAALELGRDGIRVNQVCPAGGNVEMYGPWMEKMIPFIDETLAYQEDRGIPGGAPLEAIADAVLYLASDASSGTTGADIPVDGGASAGTFIPGFNTL